VISNLDAKIAELRERRRAGQNDAEMVAELLKAHLSDHVDGIKSGLDADAQRITFLMEMVEKQINAATDAAAWLKQDHEAIWHDLAASKVLSRRQSLWAWIALGGACIAAVMVLLLAGWAANRWVNNAIEEANLIRVANAAELAEARREGQRAIAALHEELASQRAEIARAVDEAGAEFAELTGERDAIRAELEGFAALRDRLGIQIVETRSRPVIIVPEGHEIRPWRSASLHELARYNGRMFRVMAVE
jgi:hypothetical protein